jgi:hypothetical protein
MSRSRFLPDPFVVILQHRKQQHAPPLEARYPERARKRPRELFRRSRHIAFSIAGR